MSDKIILSPHIFELNAESSNIFMTLKTIFCTTNCNLNGAIFTEDFIDGIVDNQEKYIGIALVVDRNRLEKEEYDKLTHMFADGKLGTDMIGSFVSFEKIVNNDGSYSLVGEARVLKRYPKTCEAIRKLYQLGSLLFSCEASVSQYGVVTSSSREVPYAGGANFLMGNCVVTHPAEVEAKPTLLVASLDDDLLVEKTTLDNNDNLEGGQLMSKQLEINEDIIDNEEVVDENLEGAEVTPKEGEEPSGEKEDDEEVAEEDKELESAKSEIETLKAELESTKTELESVKAELSAKQEVIQVSETESAEKIISLGLIVEELKLQVNSLLPIKEERDAILAEQAKQKRLADIEDLKQYTLNSKRVTEMELTEDAEIAEAIANLDKPKIALIIAQRVVEAELANSDVSKTNSDAVVTLASVSENLLPEDSRKKWYLNQV